MSNDFIAHQNINYSNIGLYESALTGGVTTAGVLPGSASLVGGIGSVIKTVGSKEVLVKKACLKISLGENVTKAHGLEREQLRTELIKYFSDGFDNIFNMDWILCL